MSNKTFAPILLLFAVCAMSLAQAFEPATATLVHAGITAYLGGWLLGAVWNWLRPGTQSR